MENGPATENDNQLIQDFKNGKADAQRKILDRFHKSIIFFAQSLTRNRPESEEIASDIFMKLFHRHANFETLYGIKAFLYTSTRNACFNWLKTNERGNDKLPVVSLSENATAYDIADPTAMEPFKHSTDMELLARINVLVELLPPRCKEIFIRYCNGEKVHEIAKALDIEPGSVTKQLEIARTKIRAGLLLTMLLLINMVIYFFRN